MGNEAKQQAIMDTSSSALACNGTDGDGDNHSAQKLNGIELSNQTEDGHQSSHEMTAVATKVESMDDNACDELEYVVVAEHLDEIAERIELPLETDKTLGSQTLKHAFPGAYGLKYRNPATGALRALLMNTTGTRFLAPPGGWADKTFIVIYPSVPIALPPQPSSSNKKTAGGSANSSNGCGDEPAATNKRRKMMATADTGIEDTPPLPTPQKEEQKQQQQISDPDSETTNDGVGTISTTTNKKRTASPSSSELVSSKVQKSTGGAFVAKRQKSFEQVYSRTKNAKNEEEANELDEEEEDDDNSAILDEVADLIVLGLPYSLSREEFRVHFEKFGTVAHCEIKSVNGVSKGFGFIQMSTVEEQAKILRKDGVHLIGGRRCTVRFPFIKKANKEFVPVSNKVFVGRINENTKHDELRHFFTAEARLIDPMSEVTDVFIPRPFRAFAFVTFTSPDIAQEIIRKKAFEFNGMPLTASTANPRFAQHNSGMVGHMAEPSLINASVPFAPPGFNGPPPMPVGRGARGRPPPPYFEEAYQLQHQQRHENWNYDWSLQQQQNNLNRGDRHHSSNNNKAHYIPPPPPRHGLQHGIPQIVSPPPHSSGYDFGQTPMPQQTMGNGGGGNSPHPHSGNYPPPGFVGVPGAGQQQAQLATAQLETLNLNNINMNPEVMTAALKALFSLASTAAGQMIPQQQSHQNLTAMSPSQIPPGYNQPPPPPPPKHHRQHQQQQNQQNNHNQQQPYRPGGGRRGGSSPAHYSSGGTAHNINHGQGGEGVVREGGGTSAGGFGRQQQQGGGAPQGTWR